MNYSLQRILYAEDDPDMQEIARLALETVGGFTLEICSSGQEAIDSAPGFAPDLILLDVIMPGMDGPATLTELQKLPEIKSVPVIFMTADVSPKDIARYKEMGAEDVIAKPFDPMTL